MLFVPIINPDIKPWNIFNNHINPDPTISGNVIIENKEWFNSFLPEPSNNVDIGDTDWMFDNIRKFFETEEQITEMIHSLNNFTDALTVLYLSVNLTQVYLDPVEVISTRKNWPKKYESINELLTINDKQINSLTKYFSLETTIFPLAILNGKNKSIYYKKVLNRAALMLMCSEEGFTLALDKIKAIFEPEKFMDNKIAYKIIRANYNRIDLTVKLEDKFNYDLLTIAGIITWSKYISKRFSSTNKTLETFSDFNEIKKDKYLSNVTKLQTSSGSEKYGKSIFLITYLFKKYPELKTTVKMNVKKINNSI